MSRVSMELSQEELDEVEQAFTAIDIDSNGYINIAELGEAFKQANVTIPGYRVRELIGQYDQNHDNRLDLSEFKKLYQKVKRETDFGRNFKKQIATRQGIETHGGTSQASVEGTTHSVKTEECAAFSDWIWRKLSEDKDCKAILKSQDFDLYSSVNNGILICKLINVTVENTIDERTINKGENLSVYKKIENHTLALNSAMAIGCNVINIDAHDLMKGKQHLVLGILWQVIKIGLLSDINLANHPGLLLLLEEGEEPDDLRKLSPEQILIRWVNYHLRNSDYGETISNFTTDIMDSRAYTYLLHQIAPRDKGVTLDPLMEGDNLQRAESMLQEANKIDCRSFVGPADVVKGNMKLNLAFVANLFNTHPKLEPPTDLEYEAVEETREEKTYRNWMNSLGVNPFVQYLYLDLRDGKVIFQLYDMIKKGCVDWNKVHKKFNKLRMHFEILENCNYAVDLGKECKFSLVGVGGQDIQEGNETLTLALVWQLMRGYTLALLSKISSGGQPVNDKIIVEWANSRLKGNSPAKKSSFTSFQDSTLNDSKVIIDLIDCIKPGSINYETVKDCSSEDDRMSNAKYAISMARKIGAKVYALPEDIVEVKQKMVMTIFACLMLRDLQSRPREEQEQQQAC